MYTFLPRSALSESVQRIPNPPVGLYTEGDVSLLTKPCVSVVGSRKMTAYGREVLELLIPQLVAQGLCIVSGLAYGIDAHSHRIMLRCGGKGIAVLGTPLGTYYPASHYTLHRQLLATGSLVVSEYSNQVNVQKYTFRERNRIIAALSKVTLVVEAGQKSGSLSTAQAALDANQVVCVIPGDITREGSLGVLRLLQEGALPVGSAADILEHYQKPVVKPVETFSMLQ
jgi:DNA processing protein